MVADTDHGDFDYDRIVDHGRLVFGARNTARDVKQGREKVVRL